MHEPRECLVNPADFGEVAHVRFRTGDPTARAHARLCHDAVLAVNTAAAERGWDRRELAEKLAVNPRYLQRKLSGHVPVTLHDLSSWAQVLDFTISIR